MARKPLKTELTETTDLTPPPPPIGDNAAGAGQLMPTQAETHHNIEETLASIVENEKAIEYARQFLAHLLDERHDQLVAAAGDDVIVPHAHVLAVNDTAYKAYLDALSAEFIVQDSDTLKAMSPEERRAYAVRMTRRLDLALRLFVNVSWFKSQNPEAVCAWDADARRWRIAPGAFVMPGFVAGGDLFMDKATKGMRAYVYMESTEVTESYFVAKPRSAPVPINLSLDQFNYAIGKSIEAMRNPTVDQSKDEATPSRQARAARQTAAKDEATKVAAEAAEAAKQKAIDGEDSDTPEATAPELQGDRAWALGQYFRLVQSLERVLNLDVLADLSWIDHTKEAYNAITTVGMVIDRMNAKQDGKAKGKKVA